MGPVFDFWNHDNPPNAEWFVDDGMEIRTSEPVPAGAELFISYGYCFKIKYFHVFVLVTMLCKMGNWLNPMGLLSAIATSFLRFLSFLNL